MGRLWNAVTAAVTALREEPMPKPQTGERLSWDGFDYSFGEYEDHNADLANFSDRMTKYDEMRVGHATIVSQFEALLEPILSGNWTVERGPGLPLELGGEEDEQRAEFAAELIRSNLLRESAIREYRMASPFKQFLGELFTAQEFGFAVFEKQQRMQEGPLGTLVVHDRLNWIHPKSLKYLHVGKDGEFLGVTQDWTSSGYYDEEGNWHTHEAPQGDAGKWGGVYIPAERLFTHTRRKEGDRVEGRPMSRGMYGAYKRMSFFERAEVIDSQRRAIGIPWYRMGKDTPKENLSHAIKQAKSMRNPNERSMLVTQGEDVVGFVPNEANAKDLSAAMRRTGNAVRAVAGTEFKGLGQEDQGGSLALGEVLAKEHGLHIEAIADGMRESIQLGLIEPLHAMNFAGLTPPRLRGEDFTPPNLEPIVQAKGADLLGPWRGVDAQSVRERLSLAPLSEEEVAQMDEMAQTMRDRLLVGKVDEDGKPVPATDEEMEGEGDEKKPPPKQSGSPSKGEAPSRDGGGASEGKTRDAPDDSESALAELGELKRQPWREPTPREERYLRLGDIDDTFTRHVDGLTRRLRRVWDEMAEDIAGKLEAREGAVRLRGRVKRAKAKKIMENAAAVMREDGRDFVVDEIRRQVADLEGGAELADFSPGAGVDKSSSGGMVLKLSSVKRRIDGEIETSIGLDLDRMLSALEQSATQGYLDALREGLEDKAARDAVTVTLQGRSDALFTRIGRDLGSRSFNGGRAEGVADFREQGEAGEHPYKADVAVRVEILDDRTCGACERLDGKTAEVDSPDYWALQPPNGCDGGSYCRGFLDFVVQDKEAAA